jgi:hypothetical protein
MKAMALAMIVAPATPAGLGAGLEQGTRTPGRPGDAVGGYRV